MTNSNQLVNDVITTQKAQLTRDINRILETLETIPSEQEDEGNAFYGRVSGDEQEDNTSLETQLEESLELAAKDGQAIPEKNRFAEVGSGKVLRPRKEFAKLRSLVWQGKIKRLYIWKFDRLSRNQTHMHIIMNELEEHGVEIRCVKETFENSSIGKMVMALRAFVAESELENIRMRTQTGIRSRAEKGYLIPGHRRYGYDYIDVEDANGKKWKKGKYVVNEKTTCMVRIIFYFRVYKRLSKNRIADILNSEGIPSPYGKYWSPVAVGNILKFSGYATGILYLYDKQYVPRKESENLKTRYNVVEGDASRKIQVAIPVIIPSELYEAAQVMDREIGSDNPKNCRNPEDYLLRNGFVRCGDCNRSMRGQTNNYGLKSYRCGPHKYGENSCKGQTINSVNLDTAVWEYIGKIIEDYEYIKQALDYWKKKADGSHDFQSIQLSIQKIETEQDQLYRDLRRKDERGEFYLQGRMRDRALKDAQDLDKDLTRLREMLEDTQKGKQETRDILNGFEAFVNRCATLRESYETADYREKRNLLRFLGIKVRVYRKGNPDHCDRFEIDVMPEIFKETCSDSTK